MRVEVEVDIECHLCGTEIDEGKAVCSGCLDDIAGEVLDLLDGYQWKLKNDLNPDVDELVRDIKKAF